MSNKSNIQNRLAIAAASVMIGLLLGATILAPNLAGAQETTTTTAAGTADLDGLASRGARIRAALDNLVTDGTISDGQADAVAADLAADWREHGRHRFRLHAGLDVVSTAIGVTEAELREALRAGSTIAEVAESNGVSPQTVIDALAAAINARVDEALADGNIDEARAAEIKANALERATEIVNTEWLGRRQADPDGQA